MFVFLVVLVVVVIHSVVNVGVSNGVGGKFTKLKVLFK